MLLRPLTLEELEAVADAARIVLDCYDTACADPKVTLPTVLHAAMFRLRTVTEAK